MEMTTTQVKALMVETLTTAYGAKIMRDAEELETLLQKIDLVVKAHVYAGNLGDNFLCRINSLLEKSLDR